MALDLNTANAITKGLEDHGAWYLSSLLMLVVVWQAFTGRRDKAKGHEEVVAALKTVIPLTEKLLSALAVVDAKNRRRRDDAQASQAPPVGLAK